MGTAISFIDGTATDEIDGAISELAEDTATDEIGTEVPTPAPDAAPAPDAYAEPLTEITTEEQENNSPTVPDTDYAQVVAEDIATLRASFPELHRLTDITELQNPMRYAALRDLGLTAAEAYLATTPGRAVRDNRSHLSGAFPRAKASLPTGGMSRSEWETARELFSDLSDSEIYELYKKAMR